MSKYIQDLDLHPGSEYPTIPCFHCHQQRFIDDFVTCDICKQRHCFDCNAENNPQECLFCGEPFDSSKRLSEFYSLIHSYPRIAPRLFRQNAYYKEE